MNLPNITPINTSSSEDISLFTSCVSAGFPTPCEDGIERQLNLHQYLIKHPAASFFLRVSGDSMKDAGILDGDILIVDRALHARHGSIVIAVVLNELTVKQLYCKGSKIELRAQNPEYPSVIIHNEEELQIWGVVCGVTRKL